MEKSRALFSPKPASIERDRMKIVEDLRNALKTKYFLVITTTEGKVSGHVTEMNSINGSVKLKKGSTEIELNIKNILLTE
jgi:hypothetical protein